MSFFGCPTKESLCCSLRSDRTFQDNFMQSFLVPYRYMLLKLFSSTVFQSFLSNRIFSHWQDLTLPWKLFAPPMSFPLSTFCTTFPTLSPRLYFKLSVFFFTVLCIPSNASNSMSLLKALLARPQMSRLTFTNPCDFTLRISKLIQLFAILIYCSWIYFHFYYRISHTCIIFTDYFRFSDRWVAYLRCP